MAYGQDQDILYKTRERHVSQINGDASHGSELKVVSPIEAVLLCASNSVP